MPPAPLSSSAPLSPWIGALWLAALAGLLVAWRARRQGRGAPAGWALLLGVAAGLAGLALTVTEAASGPSDGEIPPRRAARLDDLNLPVPPSRILGNPPGVVAGWLGEPLGGLTDRPWEEVDGREVPVNRGLYLGRALEIEYRDGRAHRLRFWPPGGLAYPDRLPALFRTVGIPEDLPLPAPGSRAFTWSSPAPQVGGVTVTSDRLDPNRPTIDTLLIVGPGSLPSTP